MKVSTGEYKMNPYVPDCLSVSNQIKKKKHKKRHKARGLMITGGGFHSPVGEVVDSEGDSKTSSRLGMVVIEGFGSGMLKLGWIGWPQKCQTGESKRRLIYVFYLVPMMNCSTIYVNFKKN
jgi:hypothetical protein